MKGGEDDEDDYDHYDYDVDIKTDAEIAREEQGSVSVEQIHSRPLTLDQMRDLDVNLHIHPPKNQPAKVFFPHYAQSDEIPDYDEFQDDLFKQPPATFEVPQPFPEPDFFGLGNPIGSEPPDNEVDFGSGHFGRPELAELESGRERFPPPPLSLQDFDRNPENPVLHSPSPPRDEGGEDKFDLTVKHVIHHVTPTPPKSFMHSSLTFAVEPQEVNDGFDFAPEVAHAHVPKVRRPHRYKIRRPKPGLQGPNFGSKVKPEVNRPFQKGFRPIQPGVHQTSLEGSEFIKEPFSNGVQMPNPRPFKPVDDRFKQPLVEDFNELPKFEDFSLPAHKIKPKQKKKRRRKQKTRKTKITNAVKNTHPDNFLPGEMSFHNGF